MFTMLVNKVNIDHFNFGSIDEPQMEKTYDKAKGAKHKKPDTKFQESEFAEILREAERRITGGLHNQSEVTSAARRYAEDPLAAKSIEPGYNG